MHLRPQSNGASLPAAPRLSAFTFVEMLVAMSLSAMFIGTAALAFNAISQNSKQLSTIYELKLGKPIVQSLYGINSSSVRTPASPNLGRLAFVHEMQDQFHEDLSRSESVYFLARSGLNSLHPEWLEWPYAETAVENPVLDSPEAFRQYLADVDPTTAGVFTPYRNVPPDSAPNTSIFLIAPTDQPAHLKVQAVYEIDYLTLADPAGIYASVRRFKNGALTHYYDVFFDEGEHEFITPTFVAFESKSRLARNEGGSVDRFKQGSSAGPFYLFWLPDPSINPLTTESVPVPADASDPREAYGHVAGKTAFLLSAPMFPSL